MCTVSSLIFNDVKQIVHWIDILKWTFAKINKKLQVENVFTEKIKQVEMKKVEIALCDKKYFWMNFNSAVSIISYEIIEKPLILTVF